jgi:hypothetical protein
MNAQNILNHNALYMKSTGENAEMNRDRMFGGVFCMAPATLLEEKILACRYMVMAPSAKAPAYLVGEIERAERAASGRWLFHLKRGSVRWVDRTELDWFKVHDSSTWKYGWVMDDDEEKAA